MRKYSISKGLMVILGVLSLCIAPVVAMADGTETLGPPSIAIAAGSGIVAAGTGLAVQPGDISFNVPAGATVEQVLLYWEGQDLFSFTGDATITVNGNNVTGAQIGGPVFWDDGGVSTTYRADITGLGLVGSGANTLTVEGLNFTNFANGAGVLVITDDGSSLSNIEIRDGNDLAFINWPPLKDTTVAQTFTFDASSEQRTGTMSMLFSAVSGTNSSGSTFRPTAIDITVGGVTTTFNNILDSVDGQEWDTVELPVTIPAGATELTVQAFSVDNLGIGGLPASFTWNAAALSVPPEPPDCSIGDYVWEDANRDGCQDPDERPIEGVEVKLFEDCGAPAEIASTTTNAEGFYEFTGLDCGKEYRVQFGPAGDIYDYTIADQECVDGDPDASDMKDSDCGENGFSGCVTFPDPENNPDDPTIDCGYVCEGKIGDRVWLDENEDGCQDEVNTGIAGVAVTLSEDCKDRENPVTELTDEIGDYEFTGLCPGEYFVEFGGDLPNTLPDQDCDNDPDESDKKDSNCGDDILQCVELTKDNPEDPTIDCGKVPPCDLSVEKFCSEPPTAALECTDKIVATTLRYIGPDMDNATVEVDPDKSPTVVYSVDLVSGVTILTMPAENDFTVDARPDENELGAKTKIRINGVEEVIHTSCSTPYVAGLPAPLDNPKGNPSPNWFVVNFEDKDGNFSSVTDPELKEECTVFAADGASCDDGKPISLTFIYTGEDCTASNNEQGDKAKCEGDPAGAAPVQLVYVGKNAGKFTVTPAGEAIDVGDEVTITTTDKFESNTKLEIRKGGASLQDLEIHTSCSQPLAVGDQFGSLLLSRFVPEGGTAVTENILYTYRVKNNGSTDVTVDVDDDPLGMIADDQFIPANGQVELTKGALLSETTTNTVRVTDVDDPDCFAEDSVTVTVEEPPTPPCTTKVQAMLLRYTGPDISDATVEFDPDKGPTVTYSNVDLVSGVTILSKPEENGFTIDAKPDENELGAKTKIRINVVEEVIHTSCSTPFVAGAPAPLDNPKGNPSPNWFVEDFVQK